MVDNFTNDQQQPIRSNECHYVIRELDENAFLFPTKRTTFFDPELGARTVEEVTLYKAGCGHIVGYAPAELRSYCLGCGASLCVSCSGVHCSSCLNRLCTKCAKVWRQAIYCPRDYAIQITKHVFAQAWSVVCWIFSLRIT